MLHKDPHLARMDRLMHPPHREFHDAFRKGVTATEKVLDAFWCDVLAEGDAWFFYNARYQYVTYYALMINMGRTPVGVKKKLRRAIEEMEKYEPNSAQIPIYAARDVYRALRSKRVAMRLVNKALELARRGEERIGHPAEMMFPFLAMALRVELFIRADTDPAGRGVAEILAELAELENVATLHDYDREETILKLLDAGNRSDALRQLLLKDRKVYKSKRRTRDSSGDVGQIDGWLALFGPMP